MNTTKIQELDDTLIKASRKIKVLKALTWPVEAEGEFLNNWKKGQPKLPNINLAKPNVKENIEALETIAAKCDVEHPVEKFLSETAFSYANAGRMLESIGTPDFTHFSTKIYGRPDMVYKFQGFSSVEVAKNFLEITDNLIGNKHLLPTKTDITALEFADWLKVEVDDFFEHDTVEVLLDHTISSKALAGASRIRVRGSAMFSQLDKNQLLFHEAYIHTATQINGKKQPNLKSLGLGAPRTTRTQEGIAVMAELITNSIDITRLRRIALRVIAVKMALDGADFIDLFKFFLEAGQPEIESVRSAQRIFRGGAVKGGVVFTKDAVYLQGLLEVHTFLRIAIRDNRPELVKYLFAGRLTMADAIRLAPYFESQFLVDPVYMPTWATDLTRLGATMAYSAFMANIKLDHIDTDRFIESEEDFSREVNQIN
ncbi:flavohemoglobin expression-modulating QEGLA motif protein [Flexithrix dorotheae]|uniref:flavohemoglobin expression-modulating QEGLA motif protein n=1 Tax=Flexithrix dorotheae TaxID=70993 RepID=UPI0003653F3D|nr:flavohemoglobin expression-modulating QEGLA motif protein [Flexithrix dorotheae]